MVTREDNDLLTRVEGDWPMGGIMRRHWLPACLSEEVAEHDGAPVRTRMLGEDLVAFNNYYILRNRLSSSYQNQVVKATRSSAVSDSGDREAKNRKKMRRASL